MSKIEYPYKCKRCFLKDGKIVQCEEAKELFKKHGIKKEYQDHFRTKKINHQV